jgi:hypothetical protein
MASIKITDLTADKAKWYFRKDNIYANFDLPHYIHFEQILTVVAAAMSGKSLADICLKSDVTKRPISASNFENVNYTILSNKDGAYSWRPLQLIHPVLYIDLLNILTEEKHWESIKKRFDDFSLGYVNCISIPRESMDNDSDKASQVTIWWEHIEQESLRKSLEYSYMLATDITDCYGSLYTHSIEWALDENGKEGVKARYKDKKSKQHLGSIIDEKIRNMSYGQTNGIPQGSGIMDLIAEMVLGYADLELTNAIKVLQIDPKQFSILRYRDDYRIFTNDPNIGHDILKELNTVLYDLGLKMNPGKTSANEDVILASIKPEKLEVIFSAPTKQYFQKEALRIYQLSKKYPNSGLISKELSSYYDRISAQKHFQNVDFEVLMAIFTMISARSPKTINWTAAINSKLIERVKDPEKCRNLTKLIVEKFKNIPNSSFVDIWLQRISAPIGLDLDYTDKFTKVAIAKLKNTDIWGSEWLNSDVRLIMDGTDISDLPNELENKTISPVIDRKEVELFRVNYF